MLKEIDIQRRARIERAIEDQKAFLHRVPDPDTREQAETHLLTLVRMRDSIICGSGDSASS